MKKLFTLFCLLSAMTVAVAQNTHIIKGAVVDQYGNPLPGAKVESTKGNYFTTVDADGSFELEVPTSIKRIRARYVGYRNNRVKANNDNQIIKMKRPLNWFVNVQNCFAFGDHFMYGVGVKTGFLRDWGSYVKIVQYNVGQTYDEESIPGFTLGMSRRIAKHFHAYTGLGFAPVYKVDTYFNKEYEDYEPGASVDLGFVYQTKHFNLDLGYGLGIARERIANHSLQFGFGYIF